MLSISIVILCFLGYTASLEVVKDVPYPLTETKYGRIAGTYEFWGKQRLYSSFRGIPYAKPPVADLRFRAPEPPEPWSETFNATNEGQACLQRSLISNVMSGQEDCLYLNIYVPVTNKTQLLPVMVFIHGGAYVTGSGSSSLYGPEYLIFKDIILVTLNYRLGALGFLTTLDDNAPGNYGLKDQVLALKFVQENIEYFGGDKTKVTLFGQSAGSGSVSLHMVSPLSRGLFQRAITQSGTSRGIKSNPNNSKQIEVTNKVARLVGCEDTIGDNQKLIDCLRSVPASTFVDTLSAFYILGGYPLTPYAMVIENKTEANAEPFLEKTILEYYQAGDFAQVPWIVGNVQDEGIAYTASILSDDSLRDELNNNFDEYLPVLLLFDASASNEDSLSLFQNVTDFYLNGDDFVNVTDFSKIQGFIDLFSDRTFIYGIYQNIILQSLYNGNSSIWLYNFDYKGIFSYAEIIGSSDLGFKWGVCHGDELTYLFYTPLIDEILPNLDRILSGYMLTLWANFARYGDPDPNKEFGWEKVLTENSSIATSENFNFLNISGSNEGHIFQFQQQQGYFPERVNFWTQQNIFENMNFP